MAYTFKTRKPGKRTCKKCGNTFPNRVMVDGRMRMLSSRIYCLECSPFGARNHQPLHDPEAMNPERTCQTCGKAFTYLGKHNNSAGHRKGVCNACRSVLRAKRQKERAVAYKGGKCVECGYFRCLDALVFHHSDPTVKEFTVSRMYGWAWQRLQAEIDKCILLCVRCHVELHAEQNRDRPYSRARAGHADTT